MKKAIKLDLGQSQDQSSNAKVHAEAVAVVRHHGRNAGLTEAQMVKEIARITKTVSEDGEGK